MKMRTKVLMCILLEIILTVYSHPDENLSITEIVTKHKYPIEEHTIETFDGYVLKTFRIPHGKNNKSQPKKVVLIVHGLAGSADDWITLGPDALPYYLADNGFDVWLFNARGNHHSTKHTKFDPDRDAKQYWNFCWHEIGLYDLPANINYVLKHTNNEKLFYIGHSQGGTSCLVMLSELPEMNRKINIAVLLAPAAYFVDVQTTFILKITKYFYSPTARNQIFSQASSDYPKNITNQICSSPGFQSFCYNMLYFGQQLKNPTIDQNLLPVILQHLPSTFSTKQPYHYTQIMQSDEFKQFDYGEQQNLKLYGISKPPHYNLSSITTPMALFYGTGDFLASPRSVKKLGRELTNNPLLYQVPLTGFNHLEFLWARDAKKLVYEKSHEIFMNYFA